MTAYEIAYLWDSDWGAMAKDCGVSRQSLYHWRSIGRIPELQAVRITHEVIPKVKRRRELQDELEAKLKEEFCNPLSD